MEWQLRDTAPTNGLKFDAWCVDPVCGSVGVRFTDVQMRGDKSGFGFMRDTSPPSWEYLESSEGVFPMWIITHWMPLPAAPNPQPATVSELATD